jgi:hypothetical protein
MTAMNTKGHVTRFDPTFCGKVVRVAATVCVVEFLSTIALLMMWVPAYSACWSWHVPREAPEPIYPFIFVAGALTLWTCILATFWKRFANLAFAQLRWEERLRASTGWLAALYRLLQPIQVNYTALLSVVFCFFAFFVALPLIIMVRQCGP